MNFKNRKYFTLVELIIVIAIIGVLSVSAFTIVTKWLGKSRDSRRLGEINQISKGLQSYQIENGKYPMPDMNYITLTSGTNTIGYQGYVGSGVSRIIELNKITKDPMDEKYYTYTTNLSKYQLMAMLEGSGSVNLSYGGKVQGESRKEYVINVIAREGNDRDNPRIASQELISENVSQGQLIINSVYAATDYSKRYPYLVGDKLGVILSNTGGNINTPVQELYSSTTFTGINLPSIDTGAYTSYVDNTTILNGTGLLQMPIYTNQSVVTPTTQESGGGGSSQANSCASTAWVSNATYLTGSPTTTNQAWQNTNNSNPCYFSCNGGYSWNGSSCESIITQNTVLLLHGDNGLLPTTFIDSSSNNKNITRNGDTTQVTAKFSGAGFFNGVGDYLSLADSADWDFGNGDFTIDWWQKFDSISSFEAVWNQRFNTSDTNGILVYRQDSNLLFYASSTVGSLDVANGQWLGTVESNKWYHFAVVRNGNSFNLYQNGILKTIFNSSLTLRNQTEPFRIAAEGGSQPIYFKGNIDEFRISKGIARWTSNFTPPTVPYTTDSYTKLLLHMDGVGSTFSDSSGTSKAITVGGAPTQHQVYFGNGSMYFDGNGDYLSLVDSEDWNFGAGDFTIDTWVYFPNLTPGVPNYIIGQTQDSSNRWKLYLNSRDGLGLSFSFMNGGSWLVDFSQGNMNGWSANTWYHAAIIRNGNNWRLYRDGILIASTTYSGNMNNFSGVFRIGNDIIGSPIAHHYGYIDELRIIKGVAARTSNFIPPTSSY